MLSPNITVRSSRSKESRLLYGLDDASPSTKALAFLGSSHQTKEPTVGNVFW